MDTLTEILVSSVAVTNRARSDLGDVKALAASIDARGLLNPIIVDPQHVLICGHRRLEATRSLGRETILARIVETASDTLDALLMESDENDLRKPFTPSEAIAMKRMIEGKFKAEAKARQLSGLNGVAEKSRSDQVILTRGQAREKIAQAIGMGSAASMERAERVVENGIPELVDAMDREEVGINTAAKVATLPVDQQREAVSRGPEGIKEAARKATNAKPKQKKKGNRKTDEPVDSARAVPVTQAPQLSAMVMRARIMSDMAYIHADDPNSIRVLTEVRDLCNQKIEQFSKGNAK